MPVAGLQLVLVRKLSSDVSSRKKVSANIDTVHYGANIAQCLRTFYGALYYTVLCNGEMDCILNNVSVSLPSCSAAA